MSESYDSLVYLVTNEIATLLEKALFKSKFNRVMCLCIDGDLQNDSYLIVDHLPMVNCVGLLIIANGQV